MTPVSMVNASVINSKANEPIFVDVDGVGGDVDNGDGDGADVDGPDGASVVVLVVVVVVVVVVIRVDNVVDALLAPETR